MAKCGSGDVNVYSMAVYNPNDEDPSSGARSSDRRYRSVPDQLCGGKAGGGGTGGCVGGCQYACGVGITFQSAKAST